MTTPDRLLTPSEVAQMFRVNPKTVTRWATSGKIRSVTTPGGHKRFWESDILGLYKIEEIDQEG